MNSNPRRPHQELTRRLAATALLVLVLVGCGGSSSSDDGQGMQGSVETGAVSSSFTGTVYPLSIYLPPASAGPRGGLPVVYVLDGESWFDTLVGIAESTRTRVIIVGIHGSGQRSRDFVPPNSCTPGGGGHAAYFGFIRQELIPHVEGTIGGDPGQRALFGHSHGGSFVLYAMFAASAGQQGFKAYLASDASISCMPAVAYGWEQGYAAAHRELPVRLHISYATLGNYTANLEYANVIAQRSYGRLAFVAQAYTGTHGGIVPQVLSEAIGFAFADSP